MRPQLRFGPPTVDHTLNPALHHCRNNLEPPGHALVKCQTGHEPLVLKRAFHRAVISTISTQPPTVVYAGCVEPNPQ